MRCIGVIIAGSFLATCGDPGADNSSGGAEIQGENIAGNAGASNEQLAPQPAIESAGTGNMAQVDEVHPCQMQGTEHLQVAPIRAVGTEPFWGARVEGRCVTYSTPENQQGTRVWARYSAGSNGRSAWLGQLDGKNFEMRVRPEPDCSDGMSDERYPLAVELLVNGEQRKGCAKPT
jgi:uncharacterized membrane protein